LKRGKTNETYSKYSWANQGVNFFIFAVNIAHLSRHHGSCNARYPPAILDVRDVDTPGADSVLHVGGLTEDVSGFVDRGDNQNWINVPQSLEGVDYIESAQNNADVSDDRGTSLLIEVDVAEGAVLYMFIIETQPVTPFPWMNFADFGADWGTRGLIFPGLVTVESSMSGAPLARWMLELTTSDRCRWIHPFME